MELDDDGALTLSSLSLIRLRVANGAALLDAEVPGWADKINLDTFDMSYPRTCILGQLFGEYVDGRAALNLNVVTDDDVRHGFDSQGGDETIVALEYYSLGVCWEQAIDARAGYTS